MLFEHNRVFEIDIEKVDEDSYHSIELGDPCNFSINVINMNLYARPWLLPTMIHTDTLIRVCHWLNVGILFQNDIIYI